MKKILYSLITTLVICGCSDNSDNDIYQDNRDEIIEVGKQIKEIDFGDVLVSSSSAPIAAGRYLVVADYKSVDKKIHVFNASDFTHVASAGDFGQGPEEITNLGNVVWNEETREIYATDHGKLKVFGFCVDSLSEDEDYKPFVKATFTGSIFPDDYIYINDELSYGIIITPTSTSTFNQSTGVWNMATGDIRLLEYNHPEVDKKRISLAVSAKNDLYVECNNRYDLISIFDMTGKLIRNVYGPQWDNGKQMSHFSACLFVEDYLVALYDGNEYDKHTLPTKCHVFTKGGEYVKTLDAGLQILNFCYDEGNNRLIFCFNDVIQYGYLDLTNILP